MESIDGLEWLSIGLSYGRWLGNTIGATSWRATIGGHYPRYAVFRGNTIGEWGGNVVQLTEKYRPRELGDIIGQSKVVERVRRLSSRGLGGRAYWISGGSGTGKTTLGRIIAGMVADDYSITEIDAGSLTVSALADIEREFAVRPMGRGRAVIVNEAHGLRRDSVRRLLVMLESLPEYTTVIFTTTRDGEDSLFEDCIDASPLLSRCIDLALTSQGLAKLFAARARTIAESEQLARVDLPDSAYLSLVQRHRNNFRAVLQAIDSGELL